MQKVLVVRNSNRRQSRFLFAAYLADVFEDLGTTKISDFVNMQQNFLNAGYFES